MKKIVLIDNDLLIRKSWEFAATKSQITFNSFSSVAEFLKCADKFPIDSTVIYIDLELDDNLLGTVEAKKIYELGFPEIILATGNAPETIELPSYFLKIIGKRAPF
jgi:hypothetical protein